MDARGQPCLLHEPRYYRASLPSGATHIQEQGCRGGAPGCHASFPPLGPGPMAIYTVSKTPGFSVQDRPGWLRAGASFQAHPTALAGCEAEAQGCKTQMRGSFKARRRRHEQSRTRGAQAWFAQRNRWVCGEKHGQSIAASAPACGRRARLFPALPHGSLLPRLREW